MSVVRYSTFSPALFEGFYDSGLNDPEYFPPIKDFAEYQNLVGEKAVDLLKSEIETNVVSKMTFVEIWSPKFYNFETDRLVIDVEYDDDAIASYCFETRLNEFSEYLKNEFSSRDGFISFISDNVEGFKEQMKYEIETDYSTRCVQVMIEFYLLREVDLEHYEYELRDFAFETACLMRAPLELTSDVENDILRWVSTLEINPESLKSYKYDSNPYGLEYPLSRGSGSGSWDPDEEFEERLRKAIRLLEMDGFFAYFDFYPDPGYEESDYTDAAIVFLKNVLNNE